MENRKERRCIRNEEKKFSKNANKQLIIMIISIVLMFFSVFQVYYLAKYTLGYNVSGDKLKVYRWVQLLVSGEQQEQSVDQNADI